MKRRSFLRNSALAAGSISLAAPLMGSQPSAKPEKSLFEWRVYHISRAANAKKVLETYFKDALVPFLAKHGVKFAAFNDYSLEEPVKFYVLFAYPDTSTYFKVQSALFTDAAFLEAAKSYNNQPAADAVYTRYETFLLEAFDALPSLSIPADKKGLFELRIYESASEEAGNRKITMFNKEEIALFLKVGLAPIFFGKILAGAYMPALIYMVGFKDMADRDASWNRFGSHEEWNAMRVKPEYVDIVSNIRRVFLIPSEISPI